MVGEVGVGVVTYGQLSDGADEGGAAPVSYDRTNRVQIPAIKTRSLDGWTKKMAGVIWKDRCLVNSNSGLRQTDDQQWVGPGHPILGSTSFLLIIAISKAKKE